MEGELIKYFLTQSAFAALFVWLLIDTRRDSKEREVKYINTIEKLTDKISIIEEIKDDVEEIKKNILY